MLHLVNRILSAIAFWSVALLATVAMLASTRSGCSKSKAYVTAMKSDLRNMTSAQESFFAEHGRYADLASLESGGLGFRASTGVLMTIDNADATGWRATTRHRAIRATCWFGSSAAEIRCDVTPKRALGITRRPALSWAIDLWLIALSLARRQWRHAIAKA